MRSVKKQDSPRKKTVRKSHGSKPAKSAPPHKIASKGTGKRDPREPGLTQPKPAEKRSRDRVPPPQKERIRQKYVSGKGIAQISREEGRNRETVANIVHSDEMREFTLRMRERFFGLEESAVETVRHAVEQEKNAQVAYKILSDCGVIPTQAERMQMFAEQETPKDNQEAVYRIMAKFHTVAFQRSRVFGTDISKLESTLAECGGRFDENGNVVPLVDPDEPSESAAVDAGEQKKRQ